MNPHPLMAHHMVRQYHEEVARRAELFHQRPYRPHTSLVVVLWRRARAVVTAFSHPRRQFVLPQLAVEE